MRKLESKRSIVQDHEVYDEIKTITLKEVEELIVSLYKQLAEELGTDTVKTMEKTAHDYAEMNMEAINGGTAMWFEHKGFDDDYVLAGMLLAISLAGLDMLDTFLLNADKQGWLIKPSDKEKECTCEGKCPFCGSAECEIVCEINDPEDPCVCKCGDCGEYWVTK